jgi:hypothetical protein
VRRDVAAKALAGLVQPALQLVCASLLVAHARGWERRVPAVPATACGGAQIAAQAGEQA